jgi:DNA-binding transcriptional LysR family regulator
LLLNSGENRRSGRFSRIALSVLGKQSKIDPQDLAGEPVVWIARTLHPALHECVLESCQRSGYVPRIAHEVNTVSELFDLVAAGIGVGFIKRSTAEQSFARGVIFRELTGLRLLIDTAVAYRSDNRPESLQALIQLLRERSTPIRPTVPERV